MLPSLGIRVYRCIEPISRSHAGELGSVSACEAVNARKVNLVGEDYEERVAWLQGRHIGEVELHLLHGAHVVLDGARGDNWLLIVGNGQIRNLGHLLHLEAGVGWGCLHHIALWIKCCYSERVRAGSGPGVHKVEALDEVRGQGSTSGAGSAVQSEADVHA